MGQLHMIVQLEGKEIFLPNGYTCRTYADGDDVVWTNIMNLSCPKKRVVADSRAEIFGRDDFAPDGCFFVCCQGKAVGSVCAWRYSEDGKIATLGMLAVVSEHRGSALGRYLCARLFDYLLARRFVNCFLSTDDWRLPAIKTYLDMGFQPVYYEAGQRERWEKIREKLGG